MALHFTPRFALHSMSAVMTATVATVMVTAVMTATAVVTVMVTRVEGLRGQAFQ